MRAARVRSRAPWVLGVVLPLLVSTGARAQPAGLDTIRVIPSGGLRAESVALLFSGQQGGRLPARILAVGHREGGFSGVELAIEVAGFALLESSQDPLQVDVIVYLLEGAEVRTTLLRTLKIGLATQGEALAERGLRLEARLDVPPGGYEARVLVVVGDRVALRSTEVRVPAAGDTPERWPRLPPEPGWLEVGLSEEIASLDTPALPLVEIGGPTTLTWDPDAGDRAEIQLLDADGLVVSEAVAEVGAGVAIFQIGSVEEGRYRLRVAAPGIAFRDLDVLAVVAEDDPSRSWPQLIRPTRAHRGPLSPEITPTEEEGPHRPSLPAERARAEYLAVLGLLADGDSNAADALHQLEAWAYAEHGLRGLNALGALELHLAETYLAETPEGLLPVAFLHFEQYLRYRQDSEYLLAMQARRMVLRFAEPFARASPEASRLANRLLLLVGHELQSGGMPVQTRDVFQRASELDPSDPVAFLALTILAEKYGDRTAARRNAEAALALAPEDELIRLRYAVARSRGNGAKRSRRILEDLAETATQEWIRRLAAQEVSRALIRQGRLEDAEAWLRTAIEAHPADEKIRIQLTAVLESLGRFAEAQRVLEGLGPVSAQARGVRWLYGQWPEERFTASRSTVTAAVEERRAALRRGLGLGPQS